MEAGKDLKDKKTELLEYFRNRASESLSEVKNKFGENQFKKRASAINKLLIQTKENLILTVSQKADQENWTNKEILECILMITYTSYVVMLEVRNEVWEYEYMTFSRRIGELWEPFCKLCFYYPINDFELFIPPTFSEVKLKLSSEIAEYIEKLNIEEEQKQQLKDYYDKVWKFVGSGEINLELDLHFVFNGQKYNVDYKSGFGSNEKGNTNRLLLVASIYENLEENYNCMLFVRSDENNHYFRTLKRSGIWETFSGDETYSKIAEFSGFNIKDWIKTNINWETDFNAEMYEFLKSKNLIQYLTW